MGTEHDGVFARNMSGSERYEEVQVLASESPERLEELRGRFLRALSDLGGGAEEGRPAMISKVAGTGGRWVRLGGGGFERLLGHNARRRAGAQGRC